MSDAFVTKEFELDFRANPTVVDLMIDGWVLGVSESDQLFLQKTQEVEVRDGSDDCPQNHPDLKNAFLTYSHVYYATDFMGASRKKVLKTVYRMFLGTLETDVEIVQKKSPV